MTLRYRAASLLAICAVLTAAAKNTPEQPATPVEHWMEIDGARFPTEAHMGTGTVNISYDADARELRGLTATLSDGSQRELNMAAGSELELRTNVPSAFIRFGEIPADATAAVRSLIDALTTHTQYYYGDIGTSELKETWIPATFAFHGYGHYPDIEETACQWRGRGNSTWMNYEKKPFRLKFATKFAFEPTGEDSPVYVKLPKSKSHVFLANFVDCTLMRNALALKIAEELGVRYCNHFVPVNVYYSTEGDDSWYYGGEFTLTEKYGINGASVDIDETTGALLELDGSYSYDKEKYYWSDRVFNRDAIMIKDPDFDELYEGDPSVTPAERLARWQADYEAYQHSLKGDDGSAPLAEVLDIRSAVRYMMAFDICLNQEIRYPKSVFLYKRSLDPVTLPAEATPDEAEAFHRQYADELPVGDDTYRCLYHFGPVWDFDATFNCEWGDGYPTTRLHTLPLLDGDGGQFGLLTQNADFRTIWDEEWNRFVNEGGLDRVLAFFDEYAEAIATAAAQNGKAWTSPSSANLTGEAAKLRQWILDRVDFIASDANHGLY